MFTSFCYFVYLQGKLKKDFDRERKATAEWIIARLTLYDEQSLMNRISRLVMRWGLGTEIKAHTRDET